MLNLTRRAALVPYLAPPFVDRRRRAGVLVAKERRRGRPNAGADANPLQVGPALQMAAMFQLVLFVVAGVGRAFGDSGLLVSGAVLGLTDVDALTISMTKRPASRSAPTIAAEAIAIGILANCLMKLALAVVLGAPRFARATGALWRSWPRQSA